MATYTKETTINAAPDAVFAYIADLTKHPEWGQHDNSVTKRGDGPVGVGSVYDTTGHQFGTQKEAVTVTDYVPGQRFGYESTGSLGKMRHVMVVSAAGNATRLTKTMDSSQASFMAKLMTPMMNRKVPPGLEEDLRRIKAKLEAA